MGGVWSIWCRLVDERPFTVLFFMYMPVWVYEGMWYGRWLETLLLFLISLGLSFILAVVLKLLFKDRRGKEIKNVMDYRRPSAHSLIATTLTTVASLNDYILAIPLGIITILALYSRVWIGAHNKRDVVEGALSGLVLGIVIWFLFP